MRGFCGVNYEDLRAILHYVPQFRGETFVISLDGAVIESPDFSSILLDLAVLRSLSVNVVLVHGASAQVASLGAKRGVKLSNTDGTGVTDADTLEVAMDAISRLSNQVMQSLTTLRIPAASANAVHARPAGVIGGVDRRFTGATDRVDAAMLRSFLERGILPVVPPVGYDRGGGTLRMNSDAVAKEVAVALGASKLVYLSIEDPLALTGAEGRQFSSERAAAFLEEARDRFPTGFVSKWRQAIRAIRDGVTRVHLVGANRNDALLAELFSNEGIGLMIFADAYHQVRSATSADADEIYSLIRTAVEEEQLRDRSRTEVMSRINDYLVLTIDGNVVGCVAMHHYAVENLAEMACLYVKRGHNGLGYGRILIEAVRSKARELGVRHLFALSTQAAGYLEREGFRQIDDLSLLPRERLEEWKGNARNAVLLTVSVAN